MVTKIIKIEFSDFSETIVNNDKFSQEEWRIWSCQARPSTLSRPSLAGPSLLVRPSLLARPSLLLTRPSPPDKTFPDMFTDKTISEKQYPQLRRNNMQSILSPTTSINARPNIMSPVKTAVPIKTVPIYNSSEETSSIECDIEESTDQF